MSKKIACITLCVLLVFLTGADFDMGAHRGNTPVMTIGGFDVSAAMFDFFYYGSVHQAAQAGLDMSQPFDEQRNPQGQLWSDVLYEQTRDSVQMFIAIYVEARAQGYELTEQDKEQVAEQMSQVESTARSQDATAQAWLRSLYGPLLTVESFRRLDEIMMLAARFAQETVEAFEFTDDELEAVYQDDPESFAVVTFRYFAISGSNPEWTAPDADGEVSDAEREAFRAEQRAKAEDFYANVTTSEDFHGLILAFLAATGEEYYAAEDCDDENCFGELHWPEEEASLVAQPVSALANMQGVQHEWLIDPARQPNDKKMAETQAGDFGIYLFVSRGRDERPVVDVRHLLVAGSDENEGADRTRAEARQRAEELLQEWKDGDATDDSFAALASEHTDDTASIPDGGMYQVTAETQFVRPFLDWSLDESRQPGDAEIVATDFGYHIMYFVRKHATWVMRAQNNLRQERFVAFHEGLVDAADIEIHDQGMRHAMGDLIPLPAEENDENGLQ